MTLQSQGKPISLPMARDGATNRNYIRKSQCCLFIAQTVRKATLSRADTESGPYRLGGGQHYESFQ
jgi:hypothetical protein